MLTIMSQYWKTKEAITEYKLNHIKSVVKNYINNRILAYLNIGSTAISRRKKWCLSKFIRNRAITVFSS
jgi:hypothetical protein